MRAWLLVSGCLLTSGAWLSAADSTPEGLRPLGGRWYLKAGDKPVYYYRDVDRYVDLFSYHTKDSNKDGIDNVRLSHDDQFLIMESQGYPNHPTAVFPNSGNPNTIRVQNFRFKLPLVPKKAETISTLPMGPIGTAINGVVFFNPFEAGGMNAVEGYSEVWLDSCCGHPQRSGVYHYHKYPSCVKSPFKDDGKQHSPVIGFAWDGYPVYGPYESSGVMARDLKGDQALDVCNGHEDAQRGYHYHVTPGRFPYIIGGYAGMVERSNLHGPGRLQAGAIRNNAEGESRLEAVIATVRPGTASRGKTHTVQMVLAPDKSRRGNIPSQKPNWAQIGPFEAKKIDRQGDIVTMEIAIPEDAPVGVTLDCHIEFEEPNGRFGTVVFKKNDAFRVIE